MCYTLITERQAKVLNKLLASPFSMTTGELYRSLDWTFVTTGQVRSVLSILEAKGLVEYRSYSNTWVETRAARCGHYEVSCGAYGNCKAVWAPAVCNPCAVVVHVPTYIVVPPLTPIVKKTEVDYASYLVDCQRQYAIPMTQQEFLAQ